MMEFDMKNYLPQRPRQRTAEAGLASTPMPRKYGILAVDDDREVRSLLKKGLQGQGLDVWLASNGQEGLELFWRHREEIDVVLLDVCMPGLDGPQTAAALKQLDPQIRFCFLSGDLSGYTNRKLRDLGALAVIPKPFRLAEIAPMLWELAARADLSPAAV